MTQTALDALTTADFNMIGSANLVYRMSEDVGHAQGVTWNVQAQVLGENEEEDVVLVEMDIWVGARFGPPLIYAADMGSGDILKVTSALLRKDNNPRAFMRLADSFLPQFVVLDKVIVHPEWRGRKLGPVFAGLALMRLTDSAYLVGCYPKAMGTDSVAAQEKVETTWRQLGFSPGVEGVWFLEPDTWGFPSVMNKAFKQARMDLG